MTVMARTLAAKLLSNLLALAVAAAAVYGLFAWRNAPLRSGDYGLQGTYYDNKDFTGEIFRRAVEHDIDWAHERTPFFKQSWFSVVWTGTIVIPRTGTYTFYTKSDDGSWLLIDGRTVVNNGGRHALERRQGDVTLERGPHAISVRYFNDGGGGILRLFWSPPGRAGIPERIPPTLLFPIDPQGVDVSRAHATPPRDLWAAAGVFLVLGLVVLVATRRFVLRWLRGLVERPAARLDLALFLALFAAALAIRLWDLSAAGQTWDEDVYWSTARNMIDNVLNGDLRSGSWKWNVEHPPVAKWIYTLGTLASWDFGAARALSAVVGALTCAFLFVVGRDLISRRVGVGAALLCAVLPHVIAHSKVVGLEAPSGLLFTLSIWAFHRGLRRTGNDPWQVLAAVLVGLTLSVRLTNLTVLFVIVLLWLLRDGRRCVQTRRVDMSLTLALTPVVILLTMVAVNPYLWKNPIMHFGELLGSRGTDTYTEFFLGKETTEPPPTYFLIYFAVTTPVAVLGASVLGLLRFGLARQTASAVPPGEDGPRWPRWVQRVGVGQVTVLAWFVIPFVMLLSPVVQDGVRYIYPALIASCVVAAAGIDWLVGLLGARLSGRLRAALTHVAVAAAVVATGTSAVRIHPYYLDYYNVLSGGPQKVARERLFEIAWWGEGLAEAVDHLNRVAARNATVRFKANPTHVVQPRPDLVLVHHDHPDYIVYNRLGTSELKNKQDYRLIYTVSARGAALAEVYQRRPRPSSEQRADGLPTVRPIR